MLLTSKEDILMAVEVQVIFSHRRSCLLQEWLKSYQLGLKGFTTDWAERIQSCNNCQNWINKLNKEKNENSTYR
jgi:hypothetical protein